MSTTNVICPDCGEYAANPGTVCPKCRRGILEVEPADEKPESFRIPLFSAACPKCGHSLLKRHFVAKGTQRRDVDMWRQEFRLFKFGTAEVREAKLDFLENICPVCDYTWNSLPFDMS